MNYLFSLLLLVITLLFFSHAQAQNSSAVNLKSTTDQVVQPIMANQDTPGIAVAIHYGGQDYLFFYGVASKQTQIPINGNTIFELASITKVFTASLLALSVQEGKIALNDSISKYLPALAGTTGLPIDQVKVINLATHTAGFPHDIVNFGVSKEDEVGFMQRLSAWQPNTPVGNQYAYSNVGFGLLGKVVENAAGLDYPTLLANSLLQPLGMNNTFIEVPSDKIINQAQGYNARGLPAPFYTPSFLYGGGSLRSSANDMLLFLNANLGEAPNSPATLTHALQFAQQPYYQVKPNFIMGLGWQRMTRSNSLFITKNGMNAGFTSFIGFSPDRKYGVVVLANKRDAEATQIGNQLLQALSNISGG